ncbi:hypothetical protein ED733_004570 [Metarhizium rileyi]|uniref:Uncharacterized protein n=1 Tax=Metarhizium rileyi (strain RCEF 4871) TaxID=1649241 RepID=A0A5C6GFB9_METRR|nr:hypothetical protein ED733_004570 [Metarhizium rileyi]
MKPSSVLTTAAAAVSTLVEANTVPKQAEATASVALPDDGVSPRPTPPPGWERFEPRHLFGRAVTSTQTPLTMMIAPDNTCGWISGNFAVAYTCGVGATCGIVQAQKTFSGMIMCFDNVAYNFRVACVDYQMYQSSSCDHLCAENTLIVKCTNAVYPYCNTISFSSDITDYWCNSVSYSTAQGAYTTYVGQTERRIYSRLVQTFSSTLPTTATLGVPTATGGGTDTSAAATQTGSRGDDGSGSGSKTPVGAIVGGVVGGVAAISIGLVALVLCLRRNKNNGGKSQTTSNDQSPMPPNAMPGAPMTQSYYGAPAPHGYPSHQEYPQQQQQQQQQYPQTTPSPPVGYYSHAVPDLSSPTQSHAPDPRMSHVTTSPAPTWTNSYASTPPAHQPPAGFQPMDGTSPLQGTTQPQPQPKPQGAVHEVPSQTHDNHRGQMHEMA